MSSSGVNRGDAIGGFAHAAMPAKALTGNTAALVQAGILRVGEKGFEPTEKAEKIASTTSGKADFLSSAKKSLSGAASSAATTVRNFQKAVSSLVGYGNSSIATDEDFQKYIGSGALDAHEVEGLKELNLTRGQLNSIMKVPKEKMKALGISVLTFALVVQVDPGAMSRLLKAKSKNGGFTQAEMTRLAELPKPKEATSAISEMHIFTGIPLGECLGLYEEHTDNFTTLLSNLNPKELKQLGADKPLLRNVLQGGLARTLEGTLSKRDIDDLRALGKPFKMEFHQLAKLYYDNKMHTLKTISKVLGEEVSDLSPRDLKTLLDLDLDEDELEPALKASQESREQVVADDISDLSEGQRLKFLNDSKNQIPKDKLVAMLLERSKEGGRLYGLPEMRAVDEESLNALSIQELNRAVAENVLPSKIAEALPQTKGLSVAVFATIFKKAEVGSKYEELRNAAAAAKAKARAPQTALIKKIIAQDKVEEAAAKKAEQAWREKTEKTIGGIREKLQQAKARAKENLQALGESLPHPVEAAPYPYEAAPYSGRTAPYPYQAVPYPSEAAFYPDGAALYKEAEVGEVAFLESIERVEAQVTEMESRLRNMSARDAAQAMEPDSDFAGRLQAFSHTASGVAELNVGATRAKVSLVLNRYAHALDVHS